MNSKLLLEGEEIISQLKNKELTLTSARIYYDTSSFGTGDTTSIMLEKISSIQIHYSSWILFLILGLLLSIVGIMTGVLGTDYGEEIFNVVIPVVVIGGIFILLYFITRKHVVSIASDGGAKINFSIKGIKKEIIVDFINQVDKAKNNRFKLH